MSEMTAWVNRRKLSDGASMQVPFKKDKLKRKLTNILRRSVVFFLSIAYRKFRTPPKPDLRTIRSILIIPHEPIGDMVLTSPLWRILRKANPDIRIGMGVSSRNKEVLLCEGIDVMYDLYSGGFFSILKQVRRARADGWDVVLATAGFYKSTRFALISRFIAHKGITATMNNSRQARYAAIYSFCFLRPNPWDCAPMTEQYTHLLEQTFSIKIPEQDYLPHFTIIPETRREVIPQISEILEARNKSSYILINLEAKVPQREWGLNNIRELSKKMLLQREDVLLVLTASINFRMFYEAELSALEAPNIVILETPTIHHVAALALNADLIISPDTAIVHIAAALQKKLIAFYPAPDEWLPYGIKAKVLYPERWKPISSISVETVYAATISLLTS